jgi:hypothetical protein
MYGRLRAEGTWLHCTQLELLAAHFGLEEMGALDQVSTWQSTPNCFDSAIGRGHRKETGVRIQNANEDEVGPIWSNQRNPSAG